MAEVSPLIDFYKLIYRKRIPKFIIIGAQKAGTTTLFDMLNCVPEFCGSNEKETGFFIKDKFYKKGSKWYLSQFEKHGSEVINFEATPAYLYYPEAPKRIHLFNGHMKLIVLFREPAERCYSAWNMFRRFNASAPDLIFKKYTQHANPLERKAISNLLFAEHYPSFKQAVMDDLERYVSQSKDIEPSFVRRGIYCEQIANYLNYFKISDFLFLEQRELKSPPAVLKKISEFLGMNIDVNLSIIPVESNIGDYLNCDAETEETILQLRDFYKPYNQKLFNQIGIHYDWNERNR